MVTTLLFSSKVSTKMTYTYPRDPTLLHWPNSALESARLDQISSPANTHTCEWTNSALRALRAAGHCSFLKKLQKTQQVLVEIRQYNQTMPILPFDLERFTMYCSPSLILTRLWTAPFFI